MPTWATHTTVAGKFPTQGCICIGSGTFIAVGPGFILKSTDSGATWADKTPSGSHNYNSLISDGTTIVAVGPDVSNQVAVSTDDGENWTKYAIDAGNAFATQDVCTPTVGTFVAIANSTATANKRVALSTDSGATWTLKTTPAAWSGSSGNFQTIAAKDANTLVAFDGANLTDTITSADGGNTWTKQAGVLAFNMDAAYPMIRFSQGLGKYIAHGYNGSNQAVVYQSSDGITWSQLGTTITTQFGWGSFAIADAFGGFFGQLPYTPAFSPTPTIIGWSDDDGVTWTIDDTTFSPGVSGLWWAGTWDPDTGTVVFFDLDSATALLGTTASITSISPDHGTYLGGTVVTITGTGFTGFSDTITFGGTEAVSITVVSATTITCVTAAHAVGLVDVTVTGIGTLTAAYSYIGVTRVIPNKGPFSGGNSVTIRGFGFNAATGVVIDPDGDSADATDFVLVSNTTVTCTMPAHAKGLVDVEVTGVDTGTELYTYTFIASLPTETAFELPPIPYLAAPAPGSGQSPTEQFALMVKPWLTWLRTVKMTIEGLPTVSTPAEQVVGLLSVDSIPTLPWTKVSKAGSSLADLTTRSASDLDTGTLPDGRFPALTGDVTTVAGAVATTLATVNTNTPGGYGTSMRIPIITVNAKGLVTESSDVPIGGVGSWTPGSIVFIGAAQQFAQDNANLFWDDTHNVFGLGTASPISTHRLTLDTLAGSANAWRIRNGSATRYRSDYQISSSGVQFNAFDDTAGAALPFAVNASRIVLQITSGQGVGIGSTGATATAQLHLEAGTTAAHTAPLKLTSGSLMTTAEAGSVEFLTDDFYATITTGAARKGIVLNNGTPLTSGRVPFATTNGRLTDDSDLTFATDTLTATKLVAPTSVSTPSILTASGALTVTPAAGSNLDVVLSTTGDFTVNTNQIYVDTSATRVGMGTSTPGLAGASGTALTVNGTAGTNGLVEVAVNNVLVGYFRGLSSGVTQFNAVANRLEMITSTDVDIRFSPNGSEVARIRASGMSFTIGNPTAILHLRAGTATAGTAPLKFTSGTSLTTAEAGAVEFTTDDYYATITTGPARKGIVLNDGTNLTSGRVPIATTNGRLTDDSDLTFSGDTLSATKVAMSSLTSGKIPIASTAGLLIDGQTPLTGTKVYYVSDSSGGAVTRKLTFVDGILTAET